MASRVIGLDIGTHAVRAVEVAHSRGRPVLERMGQVALPAGAVVAGEIVDSSAVAAALRRLWRDVAFSTKEVVVGVANARVVARMTEMPALPEEELRSSLPFHVQELIPIPVAEAQLDFQITDRFVAESGDERVRLMLVAAQRDMLRTLLATITLAGLRPSRVDLVALAMMRALARPEGWLASESGDGLDGSAPSVGSDVIIGVGAGLTNVVVHRGGVPTFLRTVPAGGNLVTQALARDLGLSAPDAEGRKRHYDQTDAEASGLARAAIAPVLSEVVGSLDFHRSSTQGGAIDRVVLSGGGSRLVPLRDGLAEQLRVDVEIGDPFGNLRIGNVGFDHEKLASSADLFTVAVGLALAPRSTGALWVERQLNLLPAEIAADQAERRQLVLAGAGIAVFALLLLALGLYRGHQVNVARGETSDARAETASVEREIGTYAAIDALQVDLARREGLVRGALVGDLAWPTMVRDFSAALPPTLYITSLSSSAGEPGGLGQLTVSGVAGDHPDVAAFLESVEALPQVEGLWLGSSNRDASGAVSFSATGSITSAAASGRGVENGEVR